MKSLLPRIVIALGVLLILLIAAFALFSRKSVTVEVPATTYPTPTPTITSVGPFRVDLPEGWHYEPQSSKNSTVGSFKGDNITLSFDYGHYSNTLARDGDPKYDITYEVISGEQAKVVVSKIPGKGIVGVFFGDIGGTPEATLSANPPAKTTLNINGENIPSEFVEKVLKILRSVTF